MPQRKLPCTIEGCDSLRVMDLGSFKDLADAIAARHRATVDDPDVVCCAELRAA